jgi:hypothetical protein
MSLLLALLAQDVLLHEDFTDGALNDGAWEARLDLTDRVHLDPTMHGERLAAFGKLGDYLHFWGPDRAQEPPSIRSVRSFERKPGRAFLVAYCGTVHRGSAVTLGFEDGPAWRPGQRQGGPFINSARPGPDGPAIGNNNFDTLFTVILRERGAFWLADGRLAFVSESGEGAGRALIRGADAHARFRHAAVLDLGAGFLRPLPLERAEGAVECRALPAPGARSVALSLGRLRLELSSSGARVTRGDEVLTSTPEPRLEPGRERRLFLRADGAAAVDDRALPWTPVDPEGPGGAVWADGPVEFRAAQGWPARVDLPALTRDWLPPSPKRADGPVLFRDDFDGPLGKAWRAVRGDWSTAEGALSLAKAPGLLLADIGADDYEISARIEFRGPPEFPAVTVRDGGLSARYLWQNASPEIEVWDRPAGAGLTTVLANATNITGLIQPGETRTLRLGVRGGWASYWRDDLLVGTCPTRTRSGRRAGLQMDGGGNAGCRWLDVEVRAYIK